MYRNFVSLELRINQTEKSSLSISKMENFRLESGNILVNNEEWEKRTRHIPLPVSGGNGVPSKNVRPSKLLATF